MEIPVALFVLSLMTAAAVGWNISWFVFDKHFHQPLRRLLNEQSKMIEDCLKGWGEAMDLCRQAAGITKVEADGSMKSPIQVIKEEK